MKNLALLTFLLLVSAASFAQKEYREHAPWQDRVFLGGGGSLGGGRDAYGNKYFSFSVSPVIGYMLTPKVSTGTSITYQSINYSDLNVKYTQYGFMPFVRYNLDQLFLMAEFDYLNIPRLNANYDTVERLYTTRLLAGAGYAVPLGGRSKVNLIGMYDLAYKRQYFLSPWVFRVFISI